MEVAGSITRATPIVGLVRRSSSFMQAGSPSMMIDGLPNPGFVPPIVFPVGQTSSAAARAMNGLASTDGVAGAPLPHLRNLSPLNMLQSHPLKTAPPTASDVDQNVIATGVSTGVSLRPGTFAWPQIETEERAKVERFAMDSLLNPTVLRNAYWGRVETGQGMSRVTVVGHRGSGKNKSKRLTWMGGVEGLPDVRENTIRSFALAGDQGADFVEFDVQVTKDNHPVIFHDDLVWTADERTRRIGELTVDEFKRLGPQEEAGSSGRKLLRRAADGVVEPWDCAIEGPLCTLEEVFREVAQSVGFNIEVKFLDSEESLEEITRVVTATLANVKQNAGGRRIVFSTFHPDAAMLLRRLQDEHPVFFLTDGGSHLYQDPRRNSLAAAIELCMSNQLHGIVSVATAILKQPEMIKSIQSRGLQLYTYGEENNLPEAVFFQQFQGVDGLIVDNVRPVANLARSFSVRSAPASPVSRLPVEQPPISAAINEFVSKAVAVRAA